MITDDKHLTMKDRPVSERPYEKCLEYGAGSLSDGELLAVVLRSGTKNCSALDVAYLLLDAHPLHKGITGLHHMDLPSLTAIKGIGKVKAVELLCVAELARRLASTHGARARDFSSPELIAECYMEQMRHLEEEHVRLLILNGKHCLIKEEEISVGTANSACVSARDIFMTALKYQAVYLILIHNHPSGDPEPSRQDLILTRQIREAGEMLGIPLSDHIIIGNQSYVSLRERKMM